MVTLTIDGSANTITITPCNAAGVAIASPEVIAGGTIMDISSPPPGYKKRMQFDYTKWSQFGEPVPPSTDPMPNWLPPLNEYFVRIKLNGKITPVDLQLNQIFGTPYANTQAGATAAITALSAALP